MLYPPGVYRAETDTELLAGVMRQGDFARGRDVLDVGTGGGALAVAAAQAGARSVTAVDLSLRSVAATWVNSRLARARVDVRRGDLFAPVTGRRFGLVLSNPPYVPAATDALPRHRKARCWDAGPDGRALLDRICAGVPDVLTPDGTVLLVHSAVCDTDGTLDALRRAGLAARALRPRHRPLRAGDALPGAAARGTRVRRARAAVRGAGGRGGTACWVAGRVPR